MIKLVVISAVPALRAGLRALIAADPDFMVVAALDALDELPADVDLLVAAADALVEGERGGPQAGQRFERALAARPDLPVLLVANASGDIPAQLAWLTGGEARPWGIISAEAPAEALQAAVRAVAEGLVVASPELLQPLLPALAGSLEEDGDPDDFNRLERLTERETDVLRQVARGLTNKQIALALGISEHTVKFHISSVYSKLGASNRTEAVRKGARRGLIPL